MELVLDPQIRDWVLFPIMLVMFLVSILRHNITKLMRGEGKKGDIKTVQEGQILLRARRLRSNCNKLPITSFNMRKIYFNNKDSGLFKDRPGPDPMANPMANPMMDPSNMVEMMKKNLAMVVPQLFLMAWINHFFSGFCIGKIPFPLTLSFKGMLQRGIDLTTLDVSYVSSLSWYVLVLFGLRGVNQIVLGEASLGDDAQLMQEQMSMQAMGSTGAPDINKVFQSERENLELVSHEWDMEFAEKRLLGIGKTDKEVLEGGPKTKFVNRKLPVDNKKKLFFFAFFFFFIW